MKQIKEILKREAFIRHGVVYPCKNGEFSLYDNMVLYWYNDRLNSTHVIRYSLKLNKLV